MSNENKQPDERAALTECIRVLESCRLLCNWPQMGSAMDAAIKAGKEAITRATAPQATKGDERAALHAEIDRLRNDLAAAKQDAATAWERHAMANRISTQLQDARKGASE